jgi:diguanylate cyclase (GGDEF)-like protein
MIESESSKGFYNTHQHALVTGISHPISNSMEMRLPMTHGHVTGISADVNRFYEVLDYEFNRAARYKNDVALIFIKIGQLDKIGELFGHLAAKRLLRKIERLIGANIRRIDWHFHYETDELMIILPNTTINGAKSVVPKLARLIESCRFSDKEGTQIDLLPQFSIASYAHDIQSIGSADKLAGNYF